MYYEEWIEYEYETHSQFDVVCIFICNENLHFQPSLESAGHVVGHSARPDGTLDARTGAVVAKHTNQVPPTLLE